MCAPGSYKQETSGVFVTGTQTAFSAYYGSLVCKYRNGRYVCYETGSSTKSTTCLLISEAPSKFRDVLKIALAVHRSQRWTR